MSKIKLFSHCDLDGVGCAILAYLAFERENVDVEYCVYKNVDEKVEKFIEDEKLFRSYDAVFITDISISDSVANMIDILDQPPKKVRLFDHHATALWLNKYEWCEVLIENPSTNVLTCGTELFWNHLDHYSYFDKLPICNLKNLADFVEIVRNYDTWRWKEELGEEGLICKQVNDLLDIYGREEFIDWALKGILGIGSAETPMLDVFPRFSEIDLKLLEQKQKDIDIYVAEKDKQLQIATDQFGKTFGWVFAERYFSELGNRLCELHEELSYVAMIDISNGLVSFRSVREDVDLGGEIAHSLGGGGHKKAAGSRFDAVRVGKYVGFSVLNMKPNWDDIIPQYMGEPVKKEEE